MKEAVIVSTARTPIGKAYRGAFNNTEGPAMAGHAIRHAVERAGVDPGEVDDVVLGCAMQQGTTGNNAARQSLIAAGLPVGVSGMTLDRQCSSGMMAIATAAKQVIDDGMPICVGGGVESISLVQNDKMNRYANQTVLDQAKDIYMAMLNTAEVVADRYGVSRDVMDEYGLQSQMRTAAAQ
ncbi:MAG: acetyl-CoA C-acyltransferase, partial [Alphaproteobacteria bacterium]|nr:acetyl-CoA C-acyltransferase [Alphaproteobacteria bacterium]